MNQQNGGDEIIVRNPIFDRPPRPAAPTGWEKVKLNIYNRETGEFLGRTAESWRRLSIFYGLFYAVLAGFFGVSTHVLLNSLQSDRPKWILNESLIGTNPGLGYRPLSLDLKDGALICYNDQVPSTATKWVTLLDEFFTPYQKNSTGENVQECNFENSPQEKYVCAVDVDHFGPCSSENSYGYTSSSPCVFVKLNRIFGWTPEVYNKSIPAMPTDLAKAIKELPPTNRSQVWISCNGEFAADRKNIAGFNYYPQRGIPSYYFPYLHVNNYLSPVIAVEIVEPKANVVINVECRAWAKNIKFHRGNTDRQGSVHIELLRNSG